MSGIITSQYPLSLEAIPSSWESTTVGDAMRDIQPGFASGVHNQEGLGIPHLRPMNVDREGKVDLSVVKYVSPDNPLRIKAGDVLFNNTNSAELIGKTAYIGIDGELAFSNHMTRLRPPQGIDHRFVAYQLHFLWMTGYFMHRCTHHVNQASISSKTLGETVPLVVPPSLEQIRIVEEIEKQFTRLDAAVAALVRIQTNLQRYRAAVLKAACEGRLVSTEAELARRENRSYEPAAVLLERILAERRLRWEEDQGRKVAKMGQEQCNNWKSKYKEPVVPNPDDLPHLPEGWCWATLDQLSILVTSGSRGWKEYYSSDGALFIRSQDIRTDRLQLANAARVRPPKHSEGTRTAVQAGDLLVTITGANVAKTALVDVEVFEAYVSQHVGLIRLVAPELGALIHLYATAPSGGRKLLLRAAYGAGKPGLNLHNLRALPIPIPPITERGRLVDAVEHQLSVVTHLEASLDAELKTAQALRQSILKSAFEGKLVPHDPSDEDASGLLERIREDRSTVHESAPYVPRGRRKKEATHVS